jgi:surface antigen/uncharacterized protein YukE
MAATISIQTEQAIGVASNLKQNASMLEELSVDISSNINQLEIHWQGGASSESFFSETTLLKSSFIALTRDLFELSDRLILEIRECENTANHLAGSTHRGVACFGLTGTAGIGIGVAKASGRGEVLRVSAPTAGANAQTFQQMSWKDKFAEEAAINARIGELEQQLNNLPADHARALEQIDEDIAYWTKKKAEYEQESKRLIKKIPVNLRGDSASNIYKDLVNDADDMLAKLQERKDLLQSDAYWAQRKSDINSQITNLKAQQATLNQVINAGIPPSGPTRGITLAGCAKFVAEKRDISAFAVPGDMNAARWDDHAIAAGLEVGTRPVKGSIMVIDQNNSVFSKIDEVGHVAYVEKVTRVDGGYKVTYSQASTPRDANGKWTGSYIYVNPRTTTMIIPNGSTGINYIYE